MKRLLTYIAIALYFCAALAMGQTYQGMTIPSSGGALGGGHPRLLFGTPASYAKAQAWYNANYASANPGTCSVSNMYACERLAFQHVMNPSGVNATAAVTAALQIMNNATQPLPNGGQSCTIPATGDDPSNSMHDCGESLALIFDWTYDEMTPTQIAQYIAGGQIWFGTWNSLGNGNGTVGYDCSLGLDNNTCDATARSAFEWGIATYWENTANAQANLGWWNTVWSEYKAYRSHTTLAATGGGWQSAGAGGVYQEGMSYGNLDSRAFVVPSITANSLGRNVFAELPDFMAIPLFYIYHTTPSQTTTVTPGGTGTCWDTFFWNAGSAPCTGLLNYNTESPGTPVTDSIDMLAALASYFSSSNLGGYAQQLLNNLGSQTPQTPYIQALLTAPTPLAFTSLPFDYYAPGSGFFWLRKAWDGGATTVAHLELNSGSEIGHSQPWPGTWQMWRGGRWLSRESAQYFSPGLTGWDGTEKWGGQAGLLSADMNSILVNPNNQGCTAGSTCQGDGGAFNGGIGSLAPPPQVSVRSPANVSRLQDASGFAYAAVDISGTYGYNSCTNGGTGSLCNPAANSVVREYVWVRDLETLVVFDRILANNVGSVPAGNIVRTFLAHCENNWTVTGTNHAACVDGGQELSLTTLLPATPNPAYYVTNESTCCSDPNAQYRLEVNDTPGTAQSYFAHVLQGMSASGTALTPSIVDNGTSYTITLDSAHSITFNKGSTSSGGSITLSGTTTPFSTSVEPISVTSSGPVWGVSSGNTLSTTTSGTGSGTLSGSNCPGSGLASGTAYTCTATAASGSTFASLTDGCGGTVSGNTTSGTVTGSCTVSAAFTSSGPALSSISVTPATATLMAGGGTQQLAAQCNYSDGSNSNCTSTVTWTSSNPAAATVSSGGMASAVTAGSTTITASSGSITGTDSLTVDAAAALSLGLGTCSSAMTGTQYVAFSGCTLAAAGGVAPYTYSWSNSSSYASLPEGLALNSSTGALSGTVYGQGGYTTEFVVTDSQGNTATATATFALAGNNTLQGCQLFPTNSAFHINVSSLPVDSSPAAPIASSYQSDSLHVLFGASAVNNLPNGIPLLVVPSAQPDVTVNTTSGDNSYFSSGPIPAYAPIESTSNEESVGADNHVLVVQAGTTCQLYEMYQGVPPSVSGAANGAWNDNGNAHWSNLGATGTGAFQMPPEDTGTTDAAGLPVAPLVVNADEVIGTGTPTAPNGAVQHPIRFTLGATLNAHVWPATAQAGSGSCTGGYEDQNKTILQGTGAPTSCTGPQSGPMGEIYRLKASVANPACAATSPQAAIIIQGLRNYGMILADNGMSGGLIGTPDSRWNDNDLACLKSLTLSEFEPVNVSSLVADTIPVTQGSTNYNVPATYRTTVTVPSLTSINVTPATDSMLAGATQQYAAQCNYSDGSNTNCTTSVGWSSSNTAAATISIGGLASGVAAGSTTITATFGPITGTGALSVTSPPLTSITVTPATASIVAKSSTQQYAAQCNYSNGTTSNCTTAVTWSSSNLAAATISGSGLATGIAAGNSTITATFGGITGTGTLTVTNVSLSSITVTPATASIVAGTGTQQYAAQCNYSSGTTSNCTGTVIWSSSNTAAATISSGGLATAISAGSTTITATLGSITGSGVLTTQNNASVDVSSGMWAWMGGSSTAPTSGVPSAAGAPSGRQAFVNWTDGSGNLWMFGGEGYDSTGSNGYLNDLWEYVPSSQTWALMAGRSTVPAANSGWPGVYGTLGTPASGNAPGGREASTGWADKSGNLWLFGGVGYDSAGTNGSLNDLWKFVPSSQEWTWVSGSSTVPSANGGQAGTYGKLGVAAAANTPGGRQGASSWTDSDGNLWLFGGTGYDSTGSLGSLNDLWEFNSSTGEWAWMSGSSTVGTGGGQAGTYGSFGSASATVVPSGRTQAVSWTDKSGNLWLFGGKGYDSTGTLGYLNDLWEFNPSTMEWAWMGGSNTVGCAGCGIAGLYGTNGVANAANSPGGRSQAVGWTDTNGDLWLFGGDGYDSTGTNGILNDLWEFIPSTEEWAWMGGSSTVPGTNKGNAGVYGVLGIAATGNTPGSRGLTGGWTDGNGNLWLFGGHGYDASGIYGNLNDLWVYQPASGGLQAATPAFSLASGTYKTSQTVTIADTTPGAIIYYTTNGATPTSASSVYNGPITVSSTTAIEAIAMASGYKTSAEASATYTIASSFSIAVASGSASSATVKPGADASYSLVVTPVGSTTLPAAITLTASGLPPGSTATFTPSSIAAGAGTTNVSLSIQTGSTSASLVPAKSSWPLAVCLLFLPLAGIRRWGVWGKRLSAGKWLAIAGILVIAGASLAISGCSGSVAANNVATSTPTAYTVTVTAAGGSIQQTATVTVTVQ